MYKVLIPEKIPAIASELLQKAGFDVMSYKASAKFPTAFWKKHAPLADGFISLLDNRIDASVFEYLSKCKVIANYAVGFNNIDVQEATAKNIYVTNTPDVLTDATADLAFALILSAARHIVNGDAFMRAGKFKGWKPDLLLGMQLNGKILGLVGAGRIGTAVAKRASAFGMKIVYFNRSKNLKLEQLTGAKKVSLSVLMKNADVISLHLPLNKNTYHIIDANILETMKSSAILINTARGEIVDEKDLIKMLKEHRITGAGFDVYENEPNINQALLKLSNVVLAPHLGSATETARNEMAAIAAKNVIQVLKGRKPITPVNAI
jgi:glyoxylate reductase